MEEKMLNLRPILNKQSFDKISVHKFAWNVLSVRAARMAVNISSLERLSFHTPLKRLAQPSRLVGFSSSACSMELRSNTISSNLDLSFRFFNSDQNLAITGDGAVGMLAFIYASYCFLSVQR